MEDTSIYLHDIPLEQAWERFRQALAQAGLWHPLGKERLPLDRALGRITAEPVWAARSSPHYHACAMDGYAIRSEATAGASDRQPRELKLPDEACYVDTGDPLPDWADAVIPIEKVEAVGLETAARTPEAIRIFQPVTPWANVRFMGEDMVATELVLPAGHALRPVDLGAIAASGGRWVEVWRRPRVAILPTGSELVPLEEEPSAGEITEFNSLVLAAQIEAWGGEATRFPILPDDLGRLKQAVAQAAADHDLVLINAGSSAGSEDFTARVVAELGELLVHGVAVRPGHPVILGMLGRQGASEEAFPPGRPVIGVPGYPVSAALTGEIFVEPLLARWTGRAPREPEQLEATLTRKVHSSAGDLEYLRVTVGRVGGRWVAAPLSRGAGVITSLVRADGLIHIPAGVQGLTAGEQVTIRLYTPRAELERTILALGSHDLTLDLLAQFLAARGSRLTSANLGSLGGLLALRRREAHVAGSHLLDPESGEFNLAYVERYLPGEAIVVLGFVGREQGLIIQPGNPKQIQGLEDLRRPDVRFINRQRGSGTRLLLDYHLDRLGITPDSVEGFNREEFTHLGVAAAVASGRADTALAIRAAATALDLDFIPLFKERYDLIIPQAHYESRKLQPLLQVLEDQDFHQAVRSLPGYDIEPMGRVIHIFAP